MSPISHPLARPLRVAAAALAVALSALVLAACGEDKKASSTTAEPATLVPAEAIAYGEVLVQPSGEVGEGVEAALRKVVRVDDPGAELRRWLDEEAASGERGGYSRWIEPWLGDSVGVFALAGSGSGAEPPEWAAVIEASDPDRAKEMFEDDTENLEEVGEYEGVTYWRDTEEDLIGGVVEGFVVMGSLEGFRAAVQASKGRSLADDADFSEAAGSVPDDRLAWGWLDGRALVALIEQSGATEDPEIASNLEQLNLQSVGNLVVSLTMRADQIVLEGSGDGVEEVLGESGEGSLAIDDLPADAWLAFAGPLVQSQLREQLGGASGYGRMLDELRSLTGLDLERDLLSWIGGIGFFARGTSPLDLGAGLVAGSSDPAASKRFVRRIEQLAGATGLQTASVVGGDGFQVRLPDFPQPLVVLARDDRVAIAIGLGTARDAVDPPQAFGEEEPAKSAIASLGDGYRADFVLTVDPLVALLANLGATRDPEVQEVLPYLSAYRSLAMGTKVDDDRTSFKLVVGLQDPDEDQGE